ncbi:hypothetical protein CHUAL_010468 [Chamberlinius hualienensis]
MANKGQKQTTFVDVSQLQLALATKLHSEAAVDNASSSSELEGDSDLDFNASEAYSNISSDYSSQAWEASYYWCSFRKGISQFCFATFRSKVIIKSLNEKYFKMIQIVQMMRVVKGIISHVVDEVLLILKLYLMAKLH